ncbi:MAG: hypothetical protein KJ626_15775 [Verrucomicrobia bacterium]|nr:hypothetical protein [Verrucomicrobiota bacterium]
MRRLGLAWALALFVGATSASAILNGDFTSALIHWKTAWHVTSAGGEAVLADTQDVHAFVFQADEVGAGQFTIEFDFRSALSVEVPDGAFNDSFYASVYYVDTLSDFITENDKFDASQGLFDCDANGNFNINGTIGDSPKGAGWSHFSGTFNNSHTYVIVIFELYDLNFVAGDSAVRVDNVAVTAGGTP